MAGNPLVSRITAIFHSEHGPVGQLHRSDQPRDRCAEVADSRTRAPG